MNIKCLTPMLVVSLALGLPAISLFAQEPSLHGQITDVDSDKLIPARVYIRRDDGRWFFARSASDKGSAVEYRKQRGEQSVEMHTTLSAHPFVADLPPGKYKLTVERGKEYLPVTKEVEIKDKPAEVSFRLRRWIDMAGAGWYSGDTHVHRSLEELPNVVLAEDLNVALPLTYWVTVSDTPPTQGNRSKQKAIPTKLIRVDDTHVIYPLNTEYEIFSVGKKRHTLGAVFVLNHKKPLELSVPPVGPVAEQARREGALLDLDKHSWPWSLMLVPVMDVDLFELSNNHVWRTEFFFRQWTREVVPKHMEIETDDNGLTEWGWIDFGFKTYYALLNCGFRMRPTAGTASGVHPVPLGFGRVYVHLPDGFNYTDWMKGLDAGRSFVTTGPMLRVQFNGKPPGTVFPVAKREGTKCRISGSAASSVPLDRIEILVNGQIHERLKPTNAKTAIGGYASVFNLELSLDQTSWVAVRCFEKHPGGRLRFAHTAPVHFELPGRPLRPRRADVQYFINRMEQEIERNQGVLSAAAVKEYRKAVDRYREIAKRAR